MKVPTICRYCGGIIDIVPALRIYGSSTERLGLTDESLYLCQNCNARVGCHRGTTRPLGNVANEVLRLKRKETHEVFDRFWRSRGMSRSRAYAWLSAQLRIPEGRTHIGSFEMDTCQQVIDLCREQEDRRAA